jgi:sortase (surface protein transpeptidase)
MKKIAIIIGGVLVVVAVFSNIKTQYGTLEEAKWQNLKIEEKITEIKEENRILQQKIAYATESAFLDQEIHDKLAIGSSDEYWLDLGEEKDIDLFPETKEIKELSKIKQWINLFTR